MEKGPWVRKENLEQWILLKYRIKMEVSHLPNKTVLKAYNNQNHMLLKADTWMTGWTESPDKSHTDPVKWPSTVVLRIPKEEKAVPLTNGVAWLDIHSQRKKLDFTLPYTFKSCPRYKNASHKTDKEQKQIKVSNISPETVKFSKDDIRETLLALGLRDDSWLWSQTTNKKDFIKLRSFQIGMEMSVGWKGNRQSWGQGFQTTQICKAYLIP